MLYASPPRMTPAVKYLLIATLGVAIVQIIPYANLMVLQWGSMVPALAFGQGQLWRALTYLFIHGGLWHLFFNMLALWMFGIELEQRWGMRRFLVFYALGGIGAAALSAIWWNTPIIGASGAILALLTMYAYYYPDRQILLFFILPVPMRAAVFIFGIISLLAAAQPGGGIAHLAHLGGIPTGLAYIKGYPAYERWREDRDAVDREMRRRRWAEEALKREKQYEEIIDPILRKISEKGMQSLSRKEKRTLENASKETKEKIRRSPIVPLDIFTKH